MCGITAYAGKESALPFYCRGWKNSSIEDMTLQELL